MAGAREAAVTAAVGMAEARAAPGGEGVARGVTRVVEAKAVAGRAVVEMEAEARVAVRAAVSRGTAMAAVGRAAKERGGEERAALGGAAVKAAAVAMVM